MKSDSQAIDLQTIIGWKLDEARVWLEEHHGANCDLRIIETAPPAKPPRRENAQNKAGRARSSKVEATKSRERAGDWRVLRCRYLSQNDAVNESASTCGVTKDNEAPIEIVTAREILRDE